MFNWPRTGFTVAIVRSSSVGENMHCALGYQVLGLLTVYFHVWSRRMRLKRGHAFPLLNHDEGVWPERRIGAIDIDHRAILDAAGLCVHGRHDGLEGLQERAALAGLGGDDGKDVDHVRVSCLLSLYRAHSRRWRRSAGPCPA